MLIIITDGAVSDEKPNVKAIVKYNISIIYYDLC
jgi:hypothetical protein